MTTRIIPSPAGQLQDAATLPKGGRSVLAQLLHALNQPLTGLQCSMEVALATPRTADQYARSLREGLELTERMRRLVEAIREVVEVEAESDAQKEAIELRALLREVVDDLAPVAEANGVRVTLDCSTAAALEISGVRPTLAVAVFRLLDSALSLAEAGTELRVEAGTTPGGGWLHTQWNGRRPTGGFSPPELGLLIAQAGWEHVGAHWERERTETLENVSIRLPDAARF